MVKEEVKQQDMGGVINLFKGQITSFFDNEPVGATGFGIRIEKGKSFAFEWYTVEPLEELKD